MAALKVYLIKLKRSDSDDMPSLPVGTEDRLKALLDDVVKSDKKLATTFGDMTTVTVTTGCALGSGSTDLVCYVVKSNADSVTTALVKNSAATGEGLTVWTDSATCSEIYVNRMKGSGKLAGNLIFHEFLHNKSHAGDKALHGIGGLAAEIVLEGTEMTPAVRTFMARQLATPRTQWTGGCSAINDPLLGM